MPAEITNVNLLDHSSDQDSPIERIINWATTYGRYIMITTEVVVLLAFVSRFSLDRKRADLDDALSSKQAILQANISFENDVRNLQDDLLKMKGIMVDQTKPVDTLKLIQSLVPQGVTFQTFNYASSSITIDAIADTTQNFGIFVNNLNMVKKFYRISIGEIKKDNIKGITFQVRIMLIPEKVPVKKATPENTNI